MTATQRHNRTGKGFSLTELLVVVTVILILSALLFVGSSALYVSAMRLRCQHGMEQIWQACQAYSNTHGGLLPRAWDFDAGHAWYEMLPPAGYVDNAEIIACPSGGPPPGPGTPGQMEGGNSEVREAMLDALRWLQDQQDPTTGKWSSVGEEGSTSAGTTGLVLLAFLGAGCSETHPEFGSTVRMAIEYLSSTDAQASSGRFTGRYYSQALCTMALAESLHLVTDPVLLASARSAAQRGFDYLVNQQTTVKDGFDYGSTSTGPFDDRSVSAWCYQALASASKAGLQPTLGSDYASKANTFLARVKRTDGSSWYRGEDQHRVREFGEVHRMTSAMLVCRMLFSGSGTPGQDAVDRLQWILNHDHLNHLRAKSGTSEPQFRDTSWENTKIKQVYYAYYMTLALWHFGNVGSNQYWTDWETALVPALLAGKTQVDSDHAYWATTCETKSNVAGSGDTVITALACMCAEMILANYLPGSRFCTSGTHSYGYNKLLGYDRRTPAPDTIVLADYVRWGIDEGDPVTFLAPRHGGRANVLFADGHVEALGPQQLIEGDNIKRGLLTVEPGD